MTHTPICACRHSYSFMMCPHSSMRGPHVINRSVFSTWSVVLEKSALLYTIMLTSLKEIVCIDLMNYYFEYIFISLFFRRPHKSWSRISSWPSLPTFWGSPFSSWYKYFIFSGKSEASSILLSLHPGGALPLHSLKPESLIQQHQLLPEDERQIQKIQIFGEAFVCSTLWFELLLKCTGTTIFDSVF